MPTAVVNLDTSQYVRVNAGFNAFRLAWSVTNLGNTTNIDVFGTEAAAFIEGMDKSTDAAHSESGLLLAVSTVSKNILTIKCRESSVRWRS